MSRTRVLAVVLAGGAGSRMGQLTQARAKPALRFGGSFRLIDFPLSNCANSHIADVWVIQQYQPQSIEEHLANGRPWDLDRTAGGLLILHPFTGGEEEGFAEGNADAIWRHHRLIAQFGSDVILVLSADAVYTFDYRDLIDAHLAKDAEVTMATTTVVEDAGRFGVVGATAEGAVTDFSYKPERPKSDLVTMEVFAYRPSALLEVLRELADTGQPLADFGEGLLPRLVARGKAFEHRFDSYWRDVGTLDSYWQAHQDLLSDGSALQLHEPSWPIRTTGSHLPPARVAAGASVEGSLLSPGSCVAGRVVDSVLSPGVVVEAGAVVERAVVLDGAVIRSGARISKVIVDADAEVANDAEAGADGEVTLVTGG